MTTSTVDVRATVTVPKAPRLTSVDMLRGLVIILMALDHTRDFFHSQAWLLDPTDPEKSNLALYLTRWVTHFCAPTFVLLAGMSAFLQGHFGKTRGDLARFLVTRGLWLIFLEMTLINLGWNFTIPGFGLQVIWALGMAMIALAGLIWLPRRIILTIAVMIIAGHNLLDPVVPKDLGPAAPLWIILHEGGLTLTAFFVVYPILPWIGLMAFGYALGPVLLEEAAKRRKTLVSLGLLMIAFFFVERGLNIYGDPHPWKTLADPLRTAFSFMNVTKYPPSLDYILITVGPALVALALLERLKGWAADLLLVYGRAPLVFYIAHIFLIHALALAVGLAMGFEPRIFVSVLVDSTPMVKAGWGFPLIAVYGFWVLVVAALYPLCRWWGALKQRRRDWWLSYL